MYIARILYPVEVLGPGKRIGIWFCGCPRRCPGCSNPELWEFQEKYRVSADDLMALIEAVAENHRVDGFTLTGGDPFYQREALEALLPRLAAISSDILVYTGYQRQELGALPPEIGVLIDGPYLRERNNGCPLRGSDNQQLYILHPELEARYDAYLRRENRIQNFTAADGIVSVGIHRPDYEPSLREVIAQYQKSEVSYV